MPSKLLREQGRNIRLIDATGNNIKDFHFLQDIPYLETLVLDYNDLTSHVKFYNLPRLHTLWVNHNNITNLGVFITMLRKSCPRLKILSMMDNDAAPSYFNGGTFAQYQDYRLYVISQLPNLRMLDDRPVTPEEKEEAYEVYAQMCPRTVRTLLLTFQHFEG